MECDGQIGKTKEAVKCSGMMCLSHRALKIIKSVPKRETRSSMHLFKSDA